MLTMTERCGRHRTCFNLPASAGIRRWLVRRWPICLASLHGEKKLWPHQWMRCQFKRYHPPQARLTVTSYFRFSGFTPLVLVAGPPLFSPQPPSTPLNHGSQSTIATPPTPTARQISR
ncbi:hypothetical protein P280DRAFT_218695 [Massarina eburnea CBS 473.64]|uniref:Uncharacterized protein n=1 Tax=Massarina eburnea CBS 473.64 TaxID=1395130 RepID=A0A6A6SBQ3_9PLEO|nr:hypothetical protein P280DRAFT_218695 [Massarina eburnea CBS 473.64]